MCVSTLRRPFIAFSLPAQKAAREFLQARKMAPTRAHPMNPQSGGMAQMAMGGTAAAIDKAMDTMSGRQFVELKHQHPEGMM